MIPLQELFERLQVDPSYVSVNTVAMFCANFVCIARLYVRPFSQSLFRVVLVTCQ